MLLKGGHHHILLTNLIVARKVDRVFKPLRDNHLQAALAVDLDLAEELNHVVGSVDGQSCEDENQRLDQGSRVGGGKAVSHSLQQLWQERTEPLLASFVDQLGGETADVSCRIILDRRAEEAINDVQAHLQPRSPISILPSKHLLVVMEENPLGRVSAGPKNIALVRLHQQTRQLGERGSDKARGEWLRAVLHKHRKQFRCNLENCQSPNLVSITSFHKNSP